MKSIRTTLTYFVLGLSFSMGSMVTFADSPPKQTSRVIEGYGEKITITTKENGQVELHDENLRAVYSTDAEQPNPLLSKLGNVGWRYTSDRGDLVTIMNNGDRTIKIHGRGFQVHESLVNGKRLIRAFVIDAGPIQGRWNAEGSDTWRHAVDKRLFHGTVELVDLRTGEYRITDFDSLNRNTYRRDGYHKVEQLARDRESTTTYIETFGSGHRVEWKRLSVSEMEALKLDAKTADTFRITDALGSTIAITEALEGDTRTPVHVVFPGQRLWKRVGKSDIWSGKDGSGKELGKFYGLMERVGYDTIRSSDALNHQVVVYSPDGTMIHTVLEARQSVTRDLELELIDLPQYTVTWQPSGRVTLQDWSLRRLFSSDAVNEADRLSVDRKTYEVFYFDQTPLDRKIIIRSNGSRRIELHRGQGAAMETDSGGRMRREFNDKQEEIAQYGYKQEDVAEIPQPVGSQAHCPVVYLNAFQNSSGSWEMKRLANDRQQWSLISGANGVTVSLDADRVFIDRHNSLITELGNLRTIRTLDGTEIRQTTSTDSKTRTVLTAVGSRKSKGGKWCEAYSISRITDVTDVPIRVELKSKSGVYVRGANDVAYDQSPWYVLDEARRRKNIEPFYGDIWIDDLGTLIKQQYRTLPDPTHADQKIVAYRNDQAGKRKPIIDNTHQLFSTGESIQHFSDQRIIYRDKDGDILWLQPTSGQLLRIEYVLDTAEGATAEKSGGTDDCEPAEVKGDASRKPEKRVSRLEVDGKVWEYNKAIGGFVTPGFPPLHPARRGSFTNISIDMRSAVVTLLNLSLGKELLEDRAEVECDGSIRRRRSDGTEFWTRSDGRLTHLLDDRNAKLDLEYAPDGRLLRVDYEEQSPRTGKVSIVDEAYNVQADRPLHNENSIGRGLDLRGWANDWYVAYVDSQGNAVRHWPDGLIEERDPKTDEVIRIRFYNGFVVERQDIRKDLRGRPTESHSERVAIAKTIAPVSGTGFDKLISYIDESDLRVKRFFDLDVLRYDSTGRLMSMSDGSRRVTQIEYRADGTRPIRIQREDMQLTRDQFTGQCAKTSMKEGEKIGAPTPVNDFWLEPNGDVVVEYEKQAEVHVAYEFFEWRTDTRVEVRSDATFSYYDRRNRIERDENAYRLIHVYSYEGDKSEPSKTETTDPIQGLAPGASNVEFHVVNGVPIGLTRTSPGGAHVATTYKVSRSDDHKWVDSEGGVFESFWIAPDKSAAYLSADHGRTWSIIKADGSEVGARLTSDYLVLSRIFRNVHGETVAIVGTDLRATLPKINADGEIAGIEQTRGFNKMFKVKEQKSDTWELSCEPGVQLKAAVQIARNGTQTWTNPRGVMRTVNDEELVQVMFLDGSRIIHPRDQSYTRYVYAPGNDVREVTHFRSGDIELMFDDQSIWRREAYTNIITQYDSASQFADALVSYRRPFRGHLHVSETGLTTFFDEASREVAVFHPDGRSTKLRWFEKQGWVHGDSHRLYEDESQLNTLLNDIGAAPLYRHDNAYLMSDAARRNPSLFLGMHHLRDNSLEHSEAHSSSPSKPQSVAVSDSSPKTEPQEPAAVVPTPTLGQTPSKPSGRFMPMQNIPKQPENLAELPADIRILVGPALQGDSYAQFLLGKWYKENSKPEEARKWLTLSSVMFKPARDLLKEMEARRSDKK